jgi:hypothetical protein
MQRPLIALLLTIPIACEGTRGASRDSTDPPTQTSLAQKAELPQWPADREAHQLGGMDSAALVAAPSCGSDRALIAPGSIGVLRPGQSLAEVAARCPRALALWDWGDEAIPEPALVVRLGDAVVQLTLEDTLASSRVVDVRTSDPRARTAEGVGPGSSLGDLVRVYGPARFEEAECVLYVAFDRAEAMSFRLRLPRAFECTDVARLPDTQQSVPTEARVQAVIVYRLDRAT